MKPVFQTDYTCTSGNCYSACLASILELPLEDLPVFHGDFWCHQYDDWLREYSGGRLGLMDAVLDGDLPYIPEGTYAILAVPSQLHEGKLHAVVATGERKEDGVHYLRIAHDPNRKNAPLEKMPDVKGFSMIVRIDLWKRGD